MNDDDDRCRFCGSADLWDNYFDRDGFGSDGSQKGDKYRTLCQSCGNFQDQKRRR